jgi:hypothetical protein
VHMKRQRKPGGGRKRAPDSASHFINKHRTANQQYLARIRRGIPARQKSVDAGKSSRNALHYKHNKTRLALERAIQNTGLSPDEADAALFNYVQSNQAKKQTPLVHDLCKTRQGDQRVAQNFGIQMKAGRNTNRVPLLATLGEGCSIPYLVQVTGSNTLVKESRKKKTKARAKTAPVNKRKYAVRSRPRNNFPKSEVESTAEHFRANAQINSGSANDSWGLPRSKKRQYQLYRNEYPEKILMTAFGKDSSTRAKKNAKILTRWQKNLELALDGKGVVPPWGYIQAERAKNKKIRSMVRPNQKQK